MIINTSLGEIDGTRVKIKQGELTGAVISNNGFEYVSFYGIPYAKPPIGQLRFKNPEPAEGWKGVRNASIIGNIYIQFNNHDMLMPQGSEDGLFLNVFVPAKINPKERLPVMVFIHGGGFQLGSGIDCIYRPDNLIRNGIILVTLNYRLGLLGFMSLNIPEAPGNAGLKDQSMALKWVKDNIEEFGGDTDHITVFGQSGGSGSICHHMLSPMSKGLFHRAILQSGTCFDPWAIVDDPEAAIFAFAKRLNIQFHNKQELLQALLVAPAAELANLTGFSGSNKHYFGPVVEKFFEDVESFLTEAPVDIISKGAFQKIPVIVGFNTQEGILYLNRSKASMEEISMTPKEVDVAFESIVMRLNIRKKYRKQAIDVLKMQYNLPGPTDSSNHIESYINLMSDVNFIVGANKFAKIMAKHKQSTYYYQFGYHGNFNICKGLIKYEYKGAAHSDELGYVFKPKIDASPHDTSNYCYGSFPFEYGNNFDERVADRFGKLWTNFAKYGNPTPETTDLVSTIWKTVTSNTTNCLEIGKNIRMIVDPLKDRMDFWDRFMKKYNIFKLVRPVIS